MRVETDGRTDERTDGHYQMHYFTALLSHAVDKEIVCAIMKTLIIYTRKMAAITHVHDITYIYRFTYIFIDESIVFFMSRHLGESLVTVTIPSLLAIARDLKGGIAHG